MSTLTLAAHTVVFTASTLEELHDQICKYAVKVGLADAVEEAPEPMATPIPVVAKPSPFIGECGELLWITEDKVTMWLEEVPTLSQTAFQTTCGRIISLLKTHPAELAALARQMAAKNSYGAPAELVAEYIYTRWMIHVADCVDHDLSILKLQLKNANAEEYIPGFTGGRVSDLALRKQFVEFPEDLFLKRLVQLAVKLIKEHGWKAPANYNLNGTEFQKLAIDASKVKIDGAPVPSSGFGSLDTYKLQEALKVQ